MNYDVVYSMLLSELKLSPEYDFHEVYLRACCSVVPRAHPRKDFKRKCFEQYKVNRLDIFKNNPKAINYLWYKNATKRENSLELGLEKEWK